jgi:hypothetical protein
MTLGVRAGDEEGFRKICGYLGDGGKPRYPRRLDGAPRGGNVPVIVPVMTIVGPLMVAQYGY